MVLLNRMTVCGVFSEPTLQLRKHPMRGWNVDAATVADPKDRMVIEGTSSPKGKQDSAR